MKYFISDTHFGSEKIAESRKFRNAEDHDEAIIGGINDAITRKNGDILYFLGDMGMNDSAVKRALSKILCKDRRLILGNHDTPKTAAMFSEVNDTKLIKINGVPTWLSHYPHLYWPQSHYGAFHLFGHMHDKTWWSTYPGEARMWEVSVDVILRTRRNTQPLSEEWLCDFLSKRKGHHFVEDKLG